MEVLSRAKRVRDDSADVEAESELDSIKVKKIKDDLLSLLDDSDALPDRDSAGQDLDSVIRSFEEEISGSRAGSPEPVNTVEFPSDPGESLSELGKLLEDDNESQAEATGCLGDGTELVRASSESSGIVEFWDFQDEFPSYDSFGFGIDSHLENTGNDGYVELGGIFDYSDLNFGSDHPWRPETLPAV